MRGAPAYEQTHSFSAQLGDQPVQFVSKPGIPRWDNVGPAERLLCDLARLHAAARVLVLGCGHGALGVALARRVPAGHVQMADISSIAVALARQTLAANQIGNAHVAEAINLLPAHAGAFDTVMLVAPPDRKLARRQLLEAFHALAAGGELLVAGANDHGIRSIIADARALFGAATVLAYRQGQRVARALRPAAGHALPEWAGAPGIAPGTWCEFSVELRGHTLQLCSLPGVFAHDRLDAGTQLLIETIAAPQGLRVLDLGCGCGVIGALAARLGAAQAELTDTNLLAVASAAATLARNRIGAARAYAADGVPAEHAQAYDLILSNPPFHVGKAVAYDVAHAFIAQARRALAPGGQLIVVANQFLRYDQLLHAAFGQVSGLAQTSSYRIWSASCGPGD